MSDAVLLRVNGTDYGGWKEVEIQAGIERQARDFTLSITRQWPGATDIPRRVKPGDVCEVYLGSDKLLTGYVDATPIKYDGRQVSVGVRGRSKTADLVDCSARHKSGQWRNARVERIARDMAAPYGIQVVAESDTGGAVAEHQIQPGETIFESIDRLLSLRQLMATDDADGRLVFINAGSGGKADTKLALGENIREADAGLDYKDVFGEYVAQGQRSGTDYDSGATVAEISATAKDSAATRPRLLIVRESGQASAATCADRARYELAYRKAKALESTFTVQGWRQTEGGKLWLPNQQVYVVDPVIGFDFWMLIVEVTYRLTDQGAVTLLKVGPVDGYLTSKQRNTKKQKAEGESWAGVQAAK